MLPRMDASMACALHMSNKKKRKISSPDTADSSHVKNRTKYAYGLPIVIIMLKTLKNGLANGDNQAPK